MKIGIPKETKRDEYRVAMLPVGVEELVDCRVCVEEAVREKTASGSRNRDLAKFTQLTFDGQVLQSDC